MRAKAPGPQARTRAKRRLPVFLTGVLVGAGLASLAFVGLRPSPEATPVIVQAPPLPPVAIPPPRAQLPASTARATAQDPPSPVPMSSPIAATTPLQAPVSVPPESPQAPGKPDPALRDLIIPVEGARPDQLTDTYNDRRGGTRPHEALDIMAPRGTPVRATADGKIVKLFDSKPGGLTIYEFDQTGSVAYYYAHLDRYAAGVREGMPVRQGDVIAYVGSTGNASPNAPHLHFAIFRLGPEKRWWQGSPINPFPYFVTQ